MSYPRKQLGFTLLELMITFSIAAILMGLSTPMMMKMYDSMVYRGAVRDILSALESTRYTAINEGRATNLILVPSENYFQTFRNKKHYLPDDISMTLKVAGEFSQNKTAGIIRYYPDGSASGGIIFIQHVSGKRVSLRVDWLLGQITQESYEN